MSYNLKTFTPEQVAEIYQISKASVYKMIQEGRISAKRINDRLYRIPNTELSWVENGIDYDLMEMERVDKEVLDSGARDLLKKIRKKNNESYNNKSN